MAGRGKPRPVFLKFYIETEQNFGIISNSFDIIPKFCYNKTKVSEAGGRK